jgi:hypothetical protein
MNVPVTIAWDNDEHSVIRVIFENRWEVGDLLRTIEEGARMIDSVHHKVDSIFDFTLSSISPPKLLSSLERMEATHNENERLMIMVGTNPYIKSLTKIAKVLAPKTFANVHFVDTLEAAYALIKRQSPAQIA